MLQIDIISRSWPSLNTTFGRGMQVTRTSPRVPTYNSCAHILKQFLSLTVGSHSLLVNFFLAKDDEIGPFFFNLYYLYLFSHVKHLTYIQIHLCAKAYCYCFSQRGGLASVEAFLGSILVSCHLQNHSSYHLSLERCWPLVPPGGLWVLETSPPRLPFQMSNLGASLCDP